MPYAPQTEYRGDQYAYQAISGLGRTIGGSLEEWKKKHDEIAKGLGESDTIVNRALNSGTMSPEDYTKYIGSSASQKEGIAAGIAKNQALDIADREFEAQKQYQYKALQNAIDVATIHANAMTKAAAGDPGMSPEQFAANRKYAEDHGYLAFQEPTKGGGLRAQYSPKPKPEGGDYHQPGDIIREPTTGVPIGLWQGGDKTSYFKTEDELKKQAAEAMKNGAGAEQPQQNPRVIDQGTFWNFLAHGPDLKPPGGFQQPAPQQNAAPKVLSQQDQQVLQWAQQNPRDPRAIQWLKDKGL